MPIVGLVALFSIVLADEFNLQFSIDLATNETLKKKTARAEKAVRHLFVSNKIKHQHFIRFTYQAGSWHKPQQWDNHVLLSENED